MKKIKPLPWNRSILRAKMILEQEIRKRRIDITQLRKEKEDFLIKEEIKMVEIEHDTLRICYLKIFGEEAWKKFKERTYEDLL